MGRLADQVPACRVAPPLQFKRGTSDTRAWIAHMPSIAEYTRAPCRSLKSMKPVSVRQAADADNSDRLRGAIAASGEP